MPFDGLALLAKLNAKANISNLTFGAITGSEKSVGIAFEGTAFGRGKDTQNNKLGAIHLTLSQNSNLIFNSNAGELDSLSGSNANISLVGNKSRISNSSLQLRSLTRGKIEATLGYFFATDFGMSTESVSEKGASLYLGLGYEYDYVSGGNIDYKVNQNSSSAQSSAIGPDGRMVLNLGSNILLNDTVRMYFEKNFFGKIDKEYQINAGIRIGLGEEKIPQPQKEEESAPLKIEE